MDVVNSFLPKRFAVGTTAEDDSEYKALLGTIREIDVYEGSPALKKLTDFRANWDAQQRDAVHAAAKTIHSRCEGEHQLVLVKKQEAEEKESRRNIESLKKQAEREEKEFQREMTRLKKEEERLLGKAEKNMQIADKLQRELDDRRAAEDAFLEKLQPRHIPLQKRFEHTHILAPSGFGKTTLLQKIFLKDMAEDEEPSYVVIDPKGFMVKRLSRLAIFSPTRGALFNRLVIVDATSDVPAALNLFPQPSDNIPAKHRARIFNQLIETFGFIFSSAKAPITQRQSVPFTFVLRLLFAIGGNLDTLNDILRDDEKQHKYQPIALKHLDDPVAREFFEYDFYDKAFNETRQQLRTRLSEIRRRPELRAMFNAPGSLDFFDCLNTGKIILVNTAREQVGAETSTLLGRYIIAMTLNAAFARSAIPKNQWRPALLMIDEFQDFVDEEKTPELLRLAREYNLGVIMAHQGMHQPEISQVLRNVISTNTSVKYCSGPEGLDANYMANDLRCEAEFLQNVATPRDDCACFATFVRGMGIDHPFLSVMPFGEINTLEQMSSDEHDEQHRLLDEQWKHMHAPAPKMEPAIQPKTTPPQRQPVKVQPVTPEDEDDGEMLGKTW